MTILMKPIHLIKIQVDDYFDETYTFDQNDKVFAVEYLPGQFDQRANSLEECLQIISGGERPTCKSAKVYILKGNLSDEEVKTIRKTRNIRR